MVSKPHVQAKPQMFDERRKERGGPDLVAKQGLLMTRRCGVSRYKYFPKKLLQGKSPRAPQMTGWMETDCGWECIYVNSC